MKTMTFCVTLLTLWGVTHGTHGRREVNEPSKSFTQHILGRTKSVLRQAEKTIRTLVMGLPTGVKGTTAKVLDFGFKTIGKLLSFIAQLPSLLLSSSSGEAIKVIHDVVETYLRLTEILGVAGGAQKRRPNYEEIQYPYRVPYRESFYNIPKMRQDVPPYGYNPNLRFNGGGMMGYHNRRY